MNKPVRIIVAVVAVVAAVIVLAMVFGGQPDIKVDKAACRTALGTVIQDAVNGSDNLKEFQAKLETLKNDDGSINVSECKGQISDDEFNAVKKQALDDSAPFVKLAALKWATTPTGTPSTSATKTVQPAPKAADTNVQTLTGTWDEDSIMLNMVATVSKGQIKIVEHIGDNSTALEWVGTFPSVAKDHSVIVSKRNNHAMQNTLSNYGKSTLKFSLDGDHLTFVSGGDSLATSHELHRK